MFILISYWPFKHKNDCVPGAWNWQFENSSRQHINIEVIRRSSCINWTSFSLPFARNYLNLDFVLLEDFNLIVRVLLICWRNHLILTLQIDPELETDRVFFERCWNFWVNNAFSCSHPLQISRSYLPLVAFEVFVIEGALECIWDSLKASMRVVRECSWQSNFGIIEHQEGVEVL